MATINFPPFASHNALFGPPNRSSATFNLQCVTGRTLRALGGILLWASFSLPASAAPPAPQTPASAKQAPAPAQTTSPNPAGAPPTPPVGDPWRAPKPPATWTIAFKYNTPANRLPESSRASSVKVSTFEKDAAQIVEIGGRSVENWKIGGRFFTSEVNSETVSQQIVYTVPILDENGKQVATNNTGISSLTGTPMELNDWTALSEFSWIKPELFKGAIAIGGQMMLIYAEIPAEPEMTAKTKAPAPKWPAGPLGGLPLKPGIRVAAVDEATRAPKYLQLGQDILAYTFSTPEQKQISLPKKVKVLLEEAKPTGPVKSINFVP